MKEKDIHHYLLPFLKDTIGCFDAQLHKGHGHVGFADIFGLKDIGGQYGAKVIGFAVEVKKTTNPFAVNIGQALGYSLFGHRCYLAVPGKFTDSQVEMANKLGVGLIEIDIEHKTCSERLTAHHQEPIEDLFLTTCFDMGWIKCDLCKGFSKHQKNDFMSRSISKAKINDKIFRRRSKQDEVKPFYTGTYNRFSPILCRNCLEKM